MYDKSFQSATDVFNKVRSYAHAVVSEDTRFTVDDAKMRNFVHQIAETEPAQSALLSNTLSTLRQKLFFILYFGVINFAYVNPLTGSEYTYIESKSGQVLRRTNGFVAALLSMPIIWDQPKLILDLTDADWRIGLQLDKNDLYLAGQRIESVRALARAIESRQIEGIDEHRIDTNLLLESLMDTGLFEDYFLKRIQIVLYHLCMIATREGIPFAPELTFTAMADYRLPQALINAGVLVIDKEMYTKLEAGTTFRKNEHDEVVLRAYTIDICVRLAERMNITEAEVDARIWAYAQNMIATQMDILPAPRVATDCY